MGRDIGRQHVRLVLENGALLVFENDALIFESRGPVVPFTDAYLYLQMSTHSNYAAREVFFDDVVVRQGCGSDE